MNQALGRVTHGTHRQFLRPNILRLCDLIINRRKIITTHLGYRVELSAVMEQPPRKAVIVGVSGASSSGKTTLSRLLQDIFPNSFVMHEDDFSKPEKEWVLSPRRPHFIWYKSPTWPLPVITWDFPARLCYEYLLLLWTLFYPRALDADCCGSIPIKDGFLDWDCTESLVIPDIITSLEHIQKNGVMPVGLRIS